MTLVLRLKTKNTVHHSAKDQAEIDYLPPISRNINDKRDLYDRNDSCPDYA